MTNPMGHGRDQRVGGGPPGFEPRTCGLRVWRLERRHRRRLHLGDAEHRGSDLLTDNIEQSIAAVKVAGGKTTKERTPISDEIGAWAQFEDPDGRDGLFEAAR